MRWALSWRADPRAKALADRHYPRRNPDSAQFVAPGSPVVLLTPDASALWVSLRQRPEFVDHAWPGAWLCSAFRNEQPHRDRSSELVIEAVAATRSQWGNPPAEGMITFVDPTKVKHKRDPGRCFRRTGFREVARIAPSHGRGPRVVLRLSPELFPVAVPPLGAQLTMEVA